MRVRRAWPTVAAITAAGEWAWFGYRIEPSASTTNWNGLSELIVAGSGKLAVVERDKGAGKLSAARSRGGWREGCVARLTH